MTQPLHAGTLIPPKSPMAITGVFLEILRQRFSAKQNPPYVYYGRHDKDRAENEIGIEVAQNDNTQQFGFRPSIFVIRNPIQFGQVALGDKFTEIAQQAIDVYYSVAQTSFTFACEAEQPAEAEMIATIVAETFLMGADIIETTFNFKKLGPISISSRAKTRQDTDISQVNVNMGLTYDCRWASKLIAPLLAEIIVKLKDSSYTDSNEFFTEIVQNSYE